MRHGSRILGISVVGITLLIVVLTLLRLHQSNKFPNSQLYTGLCEELGDTISMYDWHVAIYIDIESCLTCNEDMDAWRELEEHLAACGVTMSLWAPSEDSVDVAVAMELEGMHTSVRIADSSIVALVNEMDMGTPVKVLLDNECRAVKIAGRMGNKRQSRCFIEEIIDRIKPTQLTTLATQ